MQYTPVIVLLLAALSQVLGQPTPVDQLIATAYLGNWYQVYTNNQALTTTQRNSTCTTVNYGFFGNNVVSVDNRFRQYTGDGMEMKTTGRATIDAPGVLTVTFDNVPSSFSYVVIKLGAPNANRQYSYSVITDDSESILYVLARDVADFMANSNDEVLAFLEQEGFTGTKAPVLTMHDDTCVYPGLFDPPVLVPELDVTAYMGNWFLAYNNLNIDNRVSENSKCSTIEYEQFNATTVMVDNLFRKGSPTGTLNTTGTGYALTTDEPAVLLVNFYAYPGLVFDYRVIKLGPVKDGLYEWTVDTDRFKSSVFIMARDLAVFKEEYEEEVLEWVREQGFDGPTSAPLAQYQGSDCLYPEGFEYTSGASSMPLSAMLGSLVLVISALWVSL